MFSGGLAQAVVAFGANLVLVRFLSPDEFGAFAIAMANLGLVHSALNFRLGDLIVRTKSEHIDREFMTLVSSYASTQVALTGLVSLALLWVTIGVDLGVLILWAGALLSIPVGVAVQLFEKSFDYRRISQFETASHGVSHVLTAVLAAAGAGPIVLFARNAARLAVIAVWLARLGALRLVPPRIVTASEIKALASRISDMWLDGVFEQLIERMSVLVIAASAGATGAGYFYQARRLAAAPGQLIDPIASRISFNYFSNHVAEANRVSTLARALVILLALMAGGVIAYLACAELLITHVFGARWLPVVDVLWALAVFMVCISLLAVFKAHYFATHAAIRFVLLGRAPIALITLGIGWALVISGAAAVSRLAMLLSAGYACACVLAAADVFLKRRSRATCIDKQET